MATRKTKVIVPEGNVNHTAQVRPGRVRNGLQQFVAEIRHMDRPFQNRAAEGPTRRSAVRRLRKKLNG